VPLDMCNLTINTMIVRILLALVVAKAAGQDSCSVPDDQKQDCGYVGTTQDQCQSNGCCWAPTRKQSVLQDGVEDIPWCFYQGSAPSPTPPPPAECDVEAPSREDCGFAGIDQDGCEQKGCCWLPVTENTSLQQGKPLLKDTPWCYFKQGYSACNPSLSFTPGPGGYGFTDEFYQEMFGLYENQLNINGSGAVAAALDHHTPGGNYFYHWMRDGALSMRIFMQINDIDNGISADVYTKMRAYAAWVSKVQNQPDPNQIDVRIEPKFEIPSGEPYTGGWCRPQTDGPGLRAGTLIIWANALAKSVSHLREGHRSARESEKVRDEVNDVWNLVLTDLAWIEQNGLTANGCDLWEEVQSDDFMWNRMGYAYTLFLAQQFASDVLHDASQAATLQTKMNDVVSALAGSSAHWDGDHFVSASIRPIDGSVLHALASFGATAIYAANKSTAMFTPLSEETAKTISHYNEVFCAEYPLNNVDTTASIPGVLYGRYPGDTYAGGNPWQLLSASLAEVFYLAASQLAAEVESLGDNNLMTDSQLAAWQQVLGSTADYTTLVAKMIDAGDSVLQRIFTHVQNDGGRIDEQIDKNTGSQTSAKGLTWSYANLLHALHLRKNVSFEQRGATMARSTKGGSSGRMENAALFV